MTLSDRPTLDVIDAHAGGDVGRVVLGGIGNLPPGTVADRARFLQKYADGLRRLLIHKPHGDLSQCVNLIVPPSVSNAEVGLVIMGTMGYPGFSGSNAMCAVAALLETGWLDMNEGERRLVLETPSGLAELRATCRAGRVESVAYEGFPGFVAADDRSVSVEGWGSVRYSLAYGGVFYAVVMGADVGLDPARTSVSELRRFFEAFFSVAAPGLELTHPEHGDMPPLSLALLAGRLDRDGSEAASVHVAVYMDPGVVCRGPTGTGTTALIACLARHSEISNGARIRTISPYGSEFAATLTGSTVVGGFTGVQTEISGRPYLLAHSRVIVDFDDPLISDCGLREILVGQTNKLDSP